MLNILILNKSFRDHTCPFREIALRSVPFRTVPFREIDTTAVSGVAGEVIGAVICSGIAFDLTLPDGNLKNLQDVEASYEHHRVSTQNVELVG